MTQEADEVIKSLKEVEEEISERMKSTLQRQATVIQGRQLEEEELEEMIHQP